MTNKVMPWLVFLAIAVFAPLGARADDVGLTLLEDEAIASAVAKAAPSVVRIDAIGGLQKTQGVLVGEGVTTGLVVAADGYIISSAYSFIQQPASVLVTLADGRRLAARIVARDHARKLVLLHVDAKTPLLVPQAAPRNELRVGQWAVALGRTFSADAPSVSTGIVSATQRIWGRAIQTDAKISPNNYGGPLIDIQGRVLGVLAPLSPQTATEIAGAEWYDSGIGFAIPLEDIFARLETLKQGTDIHAGLLGVALKGNQFTQPIEIAVCQPKSPAAKAGFQAGDIILQIGQTPVRRIPEMKHALGRLDAGQSVAITVQRGDQKIKKMVELVDKLTPYAHPFLGLLPRRDQAGFVVRYVYDNSPAQKAGLLAGDRLLALNGQAVENANQLRQQISEFSPGDEVQLKFSREGAPQQTAVVLAGLPTGIPPSLPPALEPAAVEVDAAKIDAAAEKNAPASGVVEIKLPEEAGECFAYVPKTYRDDTPHGVVLWLRKPGAEDRKALIKRWEKHCREQQLILLAPQPALPTRWTPTESAFIRKTLDKLIQDFNIDATRVVVHGYEAGGSMAYLFGFAQRDVVRAIAAVDAAIPLRTAPPPNAPLERLAIYATTLSEESTAGRAEAILERLAEMKYPITKVKLKKKAGGLTEEQRAELVRWIDSLDRI